ncbi:MAG: aminotransferase class I/II-fold pyridoxal phosphate-dependent enzyme [Polyangiaceae bacterium]|nr:aminotransferase class I/II-fold pyridoxal phosphate-dependent enzyme [Polyangiaceae bacterium]
MPASANEYELFGAGLVRYLSDNLPRAEELLCLTDCEPLRLSELAASCPELEEAIACERGGYLDGSLAERVCARIATEHERLSPVHIRLESGAGYALLRVMQTLLRPGDRVVVHVPAFPPLYTIPKSLGCEVIRWVADANRGWELDLEFLADHLDERTRLIVVSFPHNPTGYTPSRATFMDLVSIVRAKGVHLLCDEVYRDAADVAHELPPVADVYERGISVGGVSKVFGLPGARVGWLATRDMTILSSPTLQAAQAAVTGNVLGKVVAECALANREAILARSREILRDNVALFRRFLARHEDRIRCEGPLVGPVAFPQLLGATGSATAFCARLLADNRTLAVPGPALDFDERHVRIGLGRRRFPVALARLSELLAS